MRDLENHNIFLVPGLGADHRVYVNFRMSGYKERHLRWIKPESKNEPIEQYAERLLSQVDKYDGPKSILGLSFGGMMAIEMAKHYDFENVVIVSSIKHTDEKPKSFSLFKAGGIQHWFPASTLKYSGLLVAKLFGAQSKDEVRVLTKMLKKINPTLVKWSMRQVLDWENDWIPENLIHVHGTKDQVFPFQNLREHYSVKGGTHVMIANKAERVEQIIHDAIELKWEKKSNKKSVYPNSI